MVIYVIVHVLNFVCDKKMTKLTKKVYYFGLFDQINNTIN